MSASKVGIVLVNYNGIGFLPECLDSVSRADYRDIEIVVVDNASNDGSVAWIEHHYPNISVIARTDNAGFAAATNEGIRWCQSRQCEFVLLLNNDTVVEPDFLRALMDRAQPDVMAVPKIYFYDDRQLLNNHFGSYDFWRGRLCDRFYRKRDSRQSSLEQTGTMASACALLMPAAVIERVGMFDEAFFMYAEDADYITRAARMGIFVVFVPGAVIYHRESCSSGGVDSPLSVYYNNRNRLFFMQRYQRNFFARIFFAVYFTVTRCAVLTIYLFSGQHRQARAMIAGVVDFLRRRTGPARPQRYG